MKLADKLKVKRTQFLAEMRSITENPTGNDGDLSTEQAARFDTLKGEIASVDASISRAEYLDEIERRAQGTQLTGSGDNR